MQALFYGVACLEDVLKRAKGKKDIKFITAFRDLLFTTLAFPISAVSLERCAGNILHMSYGLTLLLGSKEPIIIIQGNCICINGLRTA